MSPRENLGRARDRLLSQLAERGTATSVDSARIIAARFADRPWLQQIVLEAQEAYSRNRWVPVEPEELLALVGNLSKRLVRSGRELLDVVVESLGRVQQRLQGETAEARLLWNEGEERAPKDEDTASDYVKNRLQDDLAGRGIVANREVQVRRQGTGIGERTDIRVDAISNDPLRGPDVITVVVETKGCWHRDLMTSMIGQLYERYMVPIGTQYGIYLVIWFSTDAWYRDDSRRAVAAGRDSGETKRRLTEQADSLNTEGTAIEVVVLDATWPPPRG